MYFGTLFNQIYIDRTDTSGNVTSTIRVPITYGPKDKVLSRVQLDPALDKPFASVLPYMSFQITKWKYDADRHLNASTRQGFLNPGNKDVAQYTYNPVAYDFDFELVIMVKNLEDGAKIVEQILPFFTPDWTATIRIIDSPEILRDIPVILEDVNSEDTWSGSFDERRYITYTLKFVMKGYLFGPIPKHRLIKFADVYGHVDGASESGIHVSPGLDVNGNPSSDPYDTVPYSQIDWSQNYGIITTHGKDLSENPVSLAALNRLAFNTNKNSEYIGTVV